jgi:predicted NBD/HSP70 family sugar kinase
MESLDRLAPGNRRILDELWRRGPTSRAEIADAVGLTRPAITQMVRELETLGLVVERPARRGGRGQPARPIGIEPTAAYTVGVNFSHTYLELGLLDLTGALVETVRAKMERPGLDGLSTTIGSEARRLLARNGVSLGKLLGVGISLPADFYPDGSLAPHAYFPELKRPNFQAVLSEAVPGPLFTENDGRASAIGERLLGAGRSLDTFMLAHIGHGVGGGIFVNGKPHKGAYGNAGLLGQFWPYGQPRPSGLDLIETLRAKGIDTPDFDRLEPLPDEAEPIVRDWVTRAAGQLSGPLARVGRFFGTGAIIIAGRLPPRLIEALAAAIDLPAVLRPLDDLPIPRIVASELGSTAGVIGAATLPISRRLLSRA